VALSILHTQTNGNKLEESPFHAFMAEMKFKELNEGWCQHPTQGGAVANTKFSGNCVRKGGFAVAALPLMAPLTYSLAEEDGF
jgi:hypothetical protein